MVAFRPLAALAAGAIAAQLPLLGLVLHGQVLALQAGWGWSTSPKCKFANGLCMEGATVEAGETCMPMCSDAAKDPSDKTALACPVSDGKVRPDNGWWSICGPGSGVCKADMALGAVVTCAGPATSITTSTTTSASNTTRTSTASSTLTSSRTSTTTRVSTAAVATQLSVAAAQGSTAAAMGLTGLALAVAL